MELKLAKDILVGYFYKYATDATAEELQELTKAISTGLYEDDNGYFQLDNAPVTWYFDTTSGYDICTMEDQIRMYSGFSLEQISWNINTDYSVFAVNDNKIETFFIRESD